MNNEIKFYFIFFVTISFVVNVLGMKKSMMVPCSVSMIRSGHDVLISNVITFYKIVQEDNLKKAYELSQKGDCKESLVENFTFKPFSLCALIWIQSYQEGVSRCMIQRLDEDLTPREAQIDGVDLNEDFIIKLEILSIESDVELIVKVNEEYFKIIYDWSYVSPMGVFANKDDFVGQELGSNSKTDKQLSLKGNEQASPKTDQNDTSIPLKLQSDSIDIGYTKAQKIGCVIVLCCAAISFLCWKYPNINAQHLMPFLKPFIAQFTSRQDIN